MDGKTVGAFLIPLGGFCFGKGHTTADFNRVGRYPSLSDVLYNSAMMGESSEVTLAD